MRIDIISAVPQLLASPLEESIIGRAAEKGLCEIHIHNLHDYGLGNYKQVDDEPYGGGAGMLLMCEPIFSVVEKLQSEQEYDEIIFMSADGDKLSQGIANELSLKKHLIILCGRYKGVDERIREKLITREISIGDYVLTGGELPACVLIDAIVRLLPGALGDAQSALSDSFQDGLVDSPQYTRPAEFKGMKVPEILTSGDHKKISEWKSNEARERTKKRRPHLL